MRRVFHSRVYGAMHKQQRRRLGLAGHRREEVWRLMAAEEARIRAALLARLPKPWWRRLWLWLARWLRKATTFARAAVIWTFRRCTPSRRRRPPHSATVARTEAR
jgi:hypothetical protein